ncbi:tRNA uridine-5-carboxymethylaminomethyl(34) synthesis GTPase MnmE [Basilea psittacipulmonis]|uniref:tRNA uridine-5-carboxymethylaminomethyl(34) synthesis GTPase MnmE n=1 Tax=Basilea psittacipulmonis TaxID=1472345 RepID=UPI0009DEA5E0
MITDKDPIVAVATAPGKGGIGVIRISYKDLTQYILNFFGKSLEPRKAYFLSFKDEDEIIDEGVVLYFKGPHSYTGEDVLELQGHGGIAVMQRLLSLCLKKGSFISMRLAEAGEFTKRAFLNNRMDLTQAEAVADLIDASSQAAAKSAIQSLRGAFSEKINKLNDQIIHLRMLVEATLDFPEEDIEFIKEYKAKEQLDAIQKELNEVFAKAKQGMIVREGLYVVLAGEPNVGKSSLLNALAEEEVAIVTSIAGTTRDTVKREIQINGIGLHIIDTAGLRKTDDEVENIGINRSWNEISKAQVLLHLKEINNESKELDEKILQKVSPNTPILNIINKIDLTDKPLKNDENTLYISAQTGQGIEELKTKLLTLAGLQELDNSFFIARQRHIEALNLCKTHLDNAYLNLNDELLDLFAEELRLAHDALGKITGTFSSDDLLGKIFGSFCIGK